MVALGLSAALILVIQYGGALVSTAPSGQTRV